jgi:hypothetical protein
MPEENHNALRYRNQPIDWWPGMVRWVVDVPHVKLLHYGKAAWKALIGKRYDAWDLSDPAKRDLFGGWTFSALGGGEKMSFFWNPSISAEERVVPISDYPTMEQYSWHSILEDLLFVKMAAQPGLVLPSAAYREGVTCPCAVRVREYVSATPFTLDEIQFEVPIPGRVAWALGGGGSFPECLHPNLLIDERDEGNVIIDATPDKTGPRLGAVRKIQHTNFTTWEEHRFVAAQVQRDGLYHLVTKSVTPPELTPLLKR